jgi:hypothetical protein
MMLQVAVFGFAARVQRRLLCFSLFWHALDIVWVGVFTVVYLMGQLVTELDTNAHPETGRAANATVGSIEFHVYTIGLTAILLLPRRSGASDVALAERCIPRARRTRHRRWAFTWCFPAHHHRAGKHQQRTRARLWRALVVVVVVGTMWIMADMNTNMMMPSGAPMTWMRH